MGAHHIRRQQIILEAEVSAQEAGRWHGHLENLHEFTLLPALERELSAVGGEQTLTIDRLEVEIEFDRLEELEAVIGEQFGPALRKALAGARRESTADPADTVFAGFIRYLRTGSLHWEMADGGVLLGRLHTLIRSWSAEQWHTFFREFIRQPAVVFGRSTQVQGEVLEQAWAVLQSYFVGDDADPATVASPVDGAAQPQSWEQWQQSLKLAGFRKSGGDNLVPNPTSSGNPDLALLDDNAEAALQYFVPNAGLVLLHPYLKYLADELEAHDPQEKLEVAKLAGLLHYAVSEDAPFAEWEHPLTKVLLGLSPREPLVGAALTEEERAFVDEFLRDIIGHWSALGNTGVAALREAFLSRPGRLSRQGEGWLLLVEERPYDLLLQKLPWGIGLVKTPWMETFLQVDWS